MRLFYDTNKKTNLKLPEFLNVESEITLNKDFFAVNLTSKIRTFKSTALLAKVLGTSSNEDKSDENYLKNEVKNIKEK